MLDFLQDWAPNNNPQNEALAQLMATRELLAYTGLVAPTATLGMYNKHNMVVESYYEWSK